MANTTEKGLNRRKMMLVTGGAVAGASALVAAPYREAIKSVARKTMVNSGIGTRMLSLGEATYEEWQAQVGTNFALGGRTNVRLVGVRALSTSGAKPSGVRTQGFAAFFDPGSETVAPDLIYTATHETYGPTQLFLAASGDRRTPGRMVAVFN
ncbi:MAG TPA: hypothetical protein VMG08_18375 [Allosphingosinicella sp.]|nr:hypothetical protein [Allosphingosinicella sp.]